MNNIEQDIEQLKQKYPRLNQAEDNYKIMRELWDDYDGGSFAYNSNSESFSENLKNFLITANEDEKKLFEIYLINKYGRNK